MKQIKQDAKYAMVVPSSMGVRICPPSGQPVQSSDLFIMQATSAETNVLSISSYLGKRTKVLTAFVKGSPIADYIKRDLRSRGIEYDGPEVPQGGPWGYRHQFNVADSGYGSRGPRVWNDRSGEVGRTLDAANYDLHKLFAEDGVGILHISGLIAALSEQTTKFCLELARTAHKYGTVVSFDLNYRASFWLNREEELRASFTEIASLADVLIGNEEDFQLALGVKGPEAGGKDIDQIETFKAMITAAKAAFPNVSVFANTLRQVVDVNTHIWGAILLADGEWFVAEPREIHVLDRIGGGDGFVGGMLYAMLQGWEKEKWVQFGWATGVLATTFLTDYAQPADEEQVWSIWKGNARVKR
ncbi:MAG: sugar kinase [Clostridiales bacterium]|jgi:2-dehydro-3-deoxygluconokinase|nr:sugar kinase [Clostridiales bacterium]